MNMDDLINEQRLRQTVAAAKAAYLAGEEQRSSSRLEFLYQQSRYIKKRWWAWQALLLAITCLVMAEEDAVVLIRRCLGLAGPLFVILILPELWKNRSCDAMEVEGTTFYTLRSICAARLVLFGGVDLVLLTLFFAGTSLGMHIPLWDMLIHFLIPLNVTCCICFRCLYSRSINTEALAVLLCCLWTGLWSLVVLDDKLYLKISVPMWAGLLAASCLYMVYTVCRSQRAWQNTLEVHPLWN